MKTILLALAAVFVMPTHAQEKTVLPCDVTGIAVASDASGVWFSCSRNLAALRRAVNAGQPAPLYTGANNDPTDLYWLPTATKVPVKIASAKGIIDVIAAPIGSQALVVMPQESGPGQVILYNRERRIKELPVDASFLLWSADSLKLYFYGGNTTESDAWNILGIYDLSTAAITRKQLREATEIVRVCPTNGHVYSVTPKYPGSAGSTVEYTPSAQFVRRIRGWVGARFSARCTYVASESSFHGPLPWSIYDVKTARKMFDFSILDEDGKKDSYWLEQWNPKHDSVLLRQYIPGNKGQPVREVFDVRSGRVLQTIPDADVVGWSADGNSIITADNNSLIWHPTTLPSGQ